MLIHRCTQKRLREFGQYGMVSDESSHMPTTALIAAAGLAEAAWIMTRFIMWGGLVLIALVAMAAASMSSRRAANAALLLLGVFTLVFQPWHCFWPFLTEDIARDSDVAYAAFWFRVLGAGWAMTLALVLWCNHLVRNPPSREGPQTELERDPAVVSRLLTRHQRD